MSAWICWQCFSLLLPSSTSSFKSFSRFVGLCHTLSFRTEQCTFIYATVHAFITHRDKIYRASYRILIKLFYCFFFFCHIQYPLRMIISLLQLFCFCTFLWLDWNSEEDILIHIQSARLKQNRKNGSRASHNNEEKLFNSIQSFRNRLPRNWNQFLICMKFGLTNFLCWYGMFVAL